jgi:hypothetical protein
MLEPRSVRRLLGSAMMPVVRIAALPQREGVDVQTVLSALTQRLSALLGEDERGTWASWETIEPG